MVKTSNALTEINELCKGIKDLCVRRNHVLKELEDIKIDVGEFKRLTAYYEEEAVPKYRRPEYRVQERRTQVFPSAERFVPQICVQDPRDSEYGKQMVDEVLDSLGHAPVHGQKAGKEKLRYTQQKVVQSSTSVKSSEKNVQKRCQVKVPMVGNKVSGKIDQEPELPSLRHYKEHIGMSPAPTQNITRTTKSSIPLEEEVTENIVEIGHSDSDDCIMTGFDDVLGGSEVKKEVLTVVDDNELENVSQNLFGSTHDAEDDVQIVRPQGKVITVQPIAMSDDMFRDMWQKKAVKVADSLVTLKSKKQPQRKQATLHMYAPVHRTIIKKEKVDEEPAHEELAHTQTTFSGVLDHDYVAIPEIGDDVSSVNTVEIGSVTTVPKVEKLEQYSTKSARAMLFKTRVRMNKEVVHIQQNVDLANIGPPRPPQEQSSDKYWCTRCPKGFKDKKYYRRHMLRLCPALETPELL